MNDDTNDTHDTAQFAEREQTDDASASRRTFMQAAGASAGTLAIGSSTVAAQSGTTVSADLATEQLEAGETTTVTFSISNAPTTLKGWGLEASVDSDVAKIVEVNVADTWPSNGQGNNSIDEPTSSFKMTYGAFFEDGGNLDVGASEYEFGSFILEAQGDGTTEIELSDFSLTNASDELVDAQYDAPTLTVGDVNSGPVVPGTPTELEVVAENSASVEVEWSPVSNAVEYAVSVDGTQETKTTSNSATITGLEADTTYEIGVTAISEGGGMSDTATVEATTEADAEPATPTVTVNLDDAAIDPGATTTADIGLTEAPNGLLGFIIDISVDTDVATIVDVTAGETVADGMTEVVTLEDGKATFKAFNMIPAGSSDATDIDLASVELEGVADGKTVVDVAENGTNPFEDPDGNPLEPTIEDATLTVGDGEPDEPPSVPEGLEVVAENENSLEVAWSTDPNAAEYNVYVDGEQTLTTAKTSATISDLESGTTYEIGVSAVGKNGTETDTATVSATTADPYTPPSTPEELEVVAENKSSIEVAWQSDPNAAEYAVYLDGEQQFTTSSTSATVTGLQSGTTYEIGVSAVGENGTETDTATVSATTEQAEKPEEPEEPEQPDDSEYPKWDPNTLYRGGDRVHWNGEDWEAQWTNQGKEPKYDEFHAWEPVDGEIPLEVEHLAKIDPSTTNAGTGERIDINVRDTTPNDVWITGLEWDLGDGTTASGWYVGHSYDSPGSYTVTLTATDQRGRQTTHTVTITVS